MTKLYIIGSLRNSNVPIIGQKIRDRGYEVFDDWYAGGPEADDRWQEYEKARGRTYQEALGGYAARHIFHFDQWHLNASDAAVLIAPAGKSGHLELGYMAGQGKPTFYFLDDPDRWDVMLQFCTAVVTDPEGLLDEIKRAVGEPK